jgi:hypothetical protein
VQDLSLGHELGEGADGVFDLRAGVDAVLVVEVDASVPSRSSEPSTEVRMFAGVLSSTPAPSPACEMKPNFDATTTSSRRPLRARPTSSSFA